VRRSIRIRLLLSVLALLIPLSIAAAWLLTRVFGDQLLRDIDVSLSEEAETIAELLETRAGPDTVGTLLTTIAGESGRGERKYITVVRDGSLIAEAPPGARAIVEAGSPHLRIVRYRAPHQPITVSIAMSAAAAEHAKQRLTSLLAAGVPLILVLFGAGLWAVIGRALWPLEHAAEQLNRIGAGNLSVRVAVPNRTDEVGRMVSVLNDMLDRLERTLLELQRFTADAAHELRTPLTVLRAGLEVALTRPRSASEYRAALMEALDGIDRMRQVADDLLTLARLEAASAPQAPGQVDLGEMLPELADAAAEAAGRRGLHIEVAAAAGLWVDGNAGDLYRLFNNLIDNAVGHGGDSASGGPGRDERILLCAQRRGNRIAVTVADKGPGIPPHELHRVFERFYRGNGKRSDATGTGLGLSIAQQIARTHGGHITVRNAPDGGCVATVSLPAAGTGRSGEGKRARPLRP
jgi:signal transduction histidine kinase